MKLKMKKKIKSGWVVGAEHSDGYRWLYYRNLALLGIQHTTPVIHVYPHGIMEIDSIGGVLSAKQQALAEKMVERLKGSLNG